MIDVPAKSMVLFSDIGCPWAHAAVHRWHETRDNLRLGDDVALHHRFFPLEIFNDRPTPKRTLDAEIPVAGALAPGAGWQMWRGQTYEYPVTTLPALEAVAAAAVQGVEAAAKLDRALRAAFFGRSRCISMRHVILEVAAACEGIDAGALADELDGGRHRAAVMRDKEVAEGSKVKGSPHFFLPDGSDWHNPGVEMHWENKAFPVVDKDDPSAYEEMFDRVMSYAGKTGPE